VVKALLEEDGHQVAETEPDAQIRRAVRNKSSSIFAPPSRAGTPTPSAFRAVPEEKDRSRIISARGRPWLSSRAFRVLYLEGTLRAEYGALVDPLPGQGPRFGVLRPGADAANVFLKRSKHGRAQADGIPNDQEAIDKFDVFIIGDLDGLVYPPPAGRRCWSNASARGPGGDARGYHSLGPGGYQGTLWDKCLPCNWQQGYWAAYRRILTPAYARGAAHPIFANIKRLLPHQSGRSKNSRLPSSTVARGSRARGPAPACWRPSPAEAGAMPV